VISVKLRSDPLGRPVSKESTSSTTMLCSVSAFLLLIEAFLKDDRVGGAHLRIQYTITVNNRLGEASA